MEADRKTRAGQISTPRPEQPAASSWYADREAREFLALRYLPWLTGLNLVWEFAQLPLYAIGSETSPPYVAYYVLHCTVGDMLIGAGSIVLALLVLRAPRLGDWRWTGIVAVTVFFGASYTVFSEWMNTAVLENWQYADRMPTIVLGALKLGLSPILQWLLVPPTALRLGRFGFRSNGSRPG